MDTPQQSAAVARRVSARRQRRPTHRPALHVLPPREIDPADLKNPALYVNRELSWLEFNERVLSQARDTTHPLLERVKFLAITATNLDEFFMIRVSTTLKKLREGIEDVAPDGYNTEQQLEAMRVRARRMLLDQASVWDDLRTLLALLSRPHGNGHVAAPVAAAKAAPRKVVAAPADHAGSRKAGAKRARR